MATHLMGAGRREDNLMMKSAVVAMTILGCDCDQKTCEYVRTAEPLLASVADCAASMKGEIARTRANYPLLVAVCESQPREPMAAELAGVQPDGNAAVEQVEQPAAMEHAVLGKVRERSVAIFAATRDGLGNAVEFVTLPVGWIERRISAVANLGW